MVRNDLNPKDSASDELAFIDEIRLSNLGRKMVQAARRYDLTVIEELSKIGFNDIRPIHSSIMRSIPISGANITEIADRCNNNKQAVGNLVRELVELGYLRRLRDPQDARARIVVFSDRGLKMLKSVEKVFTDIENSLAAKLGQNNLEKFEDTLSAILTLPKLK